MNVLFVLYYLDIGKSEYKYSIFPQMGYENLFSLMSAFAGKQTFIIISKSEKKSKGCAPGRIDLGTGQKLSKLQLMHDIYK